MNDRPRIQLEPSPTDLNLERIGWLAIIAMWALVLINYASLPEVIPTHYNAAGEADGFGGKITLLILPILATIMYVGMTYLNKYPHIFNYMTPITEDNAHRQYTLATRMMRTLKLAIVLIFGLIAFKIIQQANGKSDLLGIWFLPLLLALTFIPIVLYLIEASKKE